MKNLFFAYGGNDLYDSNQEKSLLLGECDLLSMIHPHMLYCHLSQYVELDSFT